MKTYDPDLVDPSVTAQEIELAHDGTPSDYTTILAAHDDGLQDDVTNRPTAFAITPPATPREAILRCRSLRENEVFVGIGMCLRENRELFKVAALWPDAATAGEHGAPAHHFDDLTKVWRGLEIFWYTDDSDDPGHVALSLGGGLCATTDYHAPGYWGVALISKLAPWCGDRFRGGREVLNRVDIWPDAAKPKPKPKPFTLQERLEIVVARERALRADHPRRAARFHLWAERLRDQIEANS